MKNLNDEQFGRLLRDAVAPVGDPELSRDLWPDMRARLDASRFRVPWFDWVLAALALVLCLIAPGAIPGLLYHL
jgi:hypothetical protein